MSSRNWVSLLACLTLLPLAACSDKERGKTETWAGVCIDADGDGYGFQCQLGRDCNDNDASIHEGCNKCDQPNEGCACADGADTVQCNVDPSVVNGQLVCKSGTRYCRDKVWTACEGLASFTAPPPSEALKLTRQGLTGDASTADGGVACGNVCNPDCYRVDNKPYDGGSDSAVITTITGGTTLIKGGGDAGSDATFGDGSYLDDYVCTPGQLPDTDCDGIPDNFDPYGSDPPFETDHTAIFGRLGPGESQAQSLNLNFKVSNADVYFYLDMTTSMDEERDNLIASLTTGNYLPAAQAGKDCADRDLDKVPDNYLKNLGVAGNIACMIRNAQFGAGWFRDIPIDPYGGSGRFSIAPNAEPMYEHRLDITSDVGALSTQLSGFLARGGGASDLKEGSTQGLWSIATGKEIHVGWDRPGIPMRTGCPAGTWGYPCFRDGTLPIIIHVTDQGMWNGPPTTVNGTTPKWSYATSDLNADKIKFGSVDTGSGNYYRTLTRSAETFDTAQDMGTIDGKVITYAGNTENFSSDYTYLSTGVCGTGTGWASNAQAAGDAVFKFTVASKNGSANRNVTLSTSGSRFSSSIMLLGSAPLGNKIFTSSGNGTFATAGNIGTVAAGERWMLNGNMSGNPSVHAREGLSLASATTCYGAVAASDLNQAVVHKFNLNANTQSLRVSGTGGGGVNMSLFSGKALEPIVYDLSRIDCGAGVVSNCNDKIGNFSIGDVGGKYVHLMNGDLTSSSVVNDYGLTEFGATCGTYGVTYPAADAVVDFSLSRPTTVRIESSSIGGATTGLNADQVHGLSIVKKVSLPLPISYAIPANSNGDLATAYTIPPSAASSTSGAWSLFTGSIVGDVPSFAQGDVGGAIAGTCNNGNAGGATSAQDVVFKFTPTATTTYEFETVPLSTATGALLPSVGYKTWLSLHNGTVGKSATIPAQNTGSTLDSATGQSLGTINNQLITVTGGQMEQRDRTYKPTLGDYCGSTANNSALGGRDALFKFTVTSTLASVTLTTVASSGAKGTVPAFDSFLAVYKGSVSGSPVTGDCPTPSWFNFNANNQSGNGWTKTLTNLTAGDYYVVVKEWKFNSGLTASGGQFGLIIEDSNFSKSFMQCDAGSAPLDNTYSRISAQLTAGTTYYLVLKGTGGATNNLFSLNVRRKPAALATLFQYCAGTTTRNAIEQTLLAGDYSLIIKGGANTTGTTKYEPKYDLTIRDLSAAPKPVGCVNSSSTTSTTTFSNLPKLDGGGNLIDYYLVTRANTTTTDYQVILDDPTMTSPPSTTCSSSGGLQPQNAQMTVALAPGSYYAVVKGSTSTDNGMFQFSVGDGSSSTAAFAPKSYINDVRAELLNKKIRVIMVDVKSSGTDGLNGGGTSSTSDGYKQTLVLAKETGAPTVSTNQTYEVNADGTGMGTQVVQAVTDLVNAVRMDMTVALNYIDPSPSKPFAFNVEALNVATGNCIGGISTDKKSHLQCGPGAIPAFKVTITNPPYPNNVPASSDPKGGWLMELDILGTTNGVTTIVDRIPVYIVPEQLPVAGTPDLYAVNGTYEQTVDTSCSGTNTPVWRSLYWNAAIPNDSSITWKMCAGDNDTDVANCTLQTVGTVKSGGACTASNQSTTCPNGYCSTSNVCEFVAGPACGTAGTATDCGTGGSCVSNVCVWNQNPIDLLPALTKGQQGKRKMRVNVSLNSSSDRLSAPTINDWHLEYRCTPGL